MSHADHVSKLPNGFKVVASSKNSKFTIIENNKKKYYKFHKSSLLINPNLGTSIN
mgnify:CR=1 FL=1